MPLEIDLHSAVLSVIVRVQYLVELFGLASQSCQVRIGICVVPNSIPTINTLP